MLTSKHTYSHICVYTYDYAVNHCLYFRNELLFNVQDTSPLYTSSTKLLLHLFKDGRQTMCVIVVMFPLLLPIITRLLDLSPLPPFPTGSPRSSNPNARRKRKPRPPTRQTPSVPSMIPPPSRNHTPPQNEPLQRHLLRIPNRQNGSIGNRAFCRYGASLDRNDIAFDCGLDFF